MVETIALVLGIFGGLVSVGQVGVWSWHRRPDRARRRRSDRQLAEFVAPGPPPIFLETFVQDNGLRIVRGAGGRCGEEPVGRMQRPGRTLDAPHDGYRFSRLRPDFGQTTVALPGPGLITSMVR